MPQEIPDALLSRSGLPRIRLASERRRKAGAQDGANEIVDDYCVMRHMKNLESVFT
jgi:hypothetical protein